MLDAALVLRLRQARKVVVFTGAGMSAESGIPTFRDRMTGLWAQVDPMEIATPWAFRAQPQRVWDWHAHLARAVRTVAPNAGHHAVAALELRGIDVTVITQNIDNLHQRAGSTRVVELHGNLLRLKSFVDEEAAFARSAPVICPACGGYAPAEVLDGYVGREDFSVIELCDGPVPRCPACAALLRPDVVWFGEPLDPDTLDAAWAAVEACDMLLAVGASLEVEPAASLPWRALQRGVPLLEVNPSPTQLARHCAAGFRSGAAQVLPDLFDVIWPVR